MSPAVETDEQSEKGGVKNPTAMTVAELKSNSPEVAGTLEDSSRLG